ncbi:MAG: hypothetical protein MUD01_07185 [Chloroflexaceae bacterium]|nr:hypothetical protein [Chloroflexaceae bacterium]
MDDLSGKHFCPEHATCPDEATLLALADGELHDPALAAQVGQCATCSHRLAHLRQLQASLHQRLYRLFCPSSDTLLWYRQGWLPPERATLVEHHLQVCPHCAAEFALFERSLGGADAWQGPGRYTSTRPIR